MKTPSIKEIRSLLISLKPYIGDEYRCTDDPNDDRPGICVTIGCSEDGSWNYQTGDNSFTGGAYGHPYWAVIYLYRRSDCTSLARDAIYQLVDASGQ